MSTTTTNYDLIKPELTDAADITVMNENWDKIDAELKKGEAFVVTATIMPSSVTLDKTFDEIYTAWSNGNKVYMSVSGGRYILTPSSVSSSSINFTTVYSYNGTLTLWVVGVFSNDTAEQITYVFPTRDELESAINAITAEGIGALPLTGGTLTGNLTVEKASYPTVSTKNTTTARNASVVAADSGEVFIYNQKDGNNRQIVMIGTESEPLASAIRLQRNVGGEITHYNIYGEHNKPTPADIGAATASHNHSASNITSGTLPVARGGTGATTFASGAALIGAGTGAVTTRAITNNTATTSAITASTNLVTMNTLRYALNRTTGIGSADTNYATAMVRAIYANTTALTAGSSSLASGVIHLQYE